MAKLSSFSSSQSFDRYHILLILILLVDAFCSIQISLAFDSEIIKFLPGFHGPLPCQLETGYVGVGESEDVQLFYYFAKSERNPRKDPLILWLSGGPGCSGICGLFYEIGPLKYSYDIEEYNGSHMPTIVSNPYTWTKMASIIFIDSPVGAGFSYARTSSASQTGDLKQVDHMVQFLRKWLINHPEFSGNPVYLGGDSYSGIPIPVLALQISKENDNGVVPPINLEGYVLGNPVTDPNFEDNFEIPFAHGMALISHELYKSLKKNCGGKYKNIDPSNTKCLKDMQTYEKCVAGIHMLHVSYPACSIESQSMENYPISGKRSIHENSEPQCLETEHILSLYWANDASVRRALGIREGTIGKWERCNFFSLIYDKDVHSSVEYHLNLSTKGYRSLIYSGDHDMRVTFLATQAWIRSLNFSIVDDWRPWVDQGQITGYTRTYSTGMTFATVKGGGHTGPQYKPRECFAMFRRWIDGEPL